MSTTSAKRQKKQPNPNAQLEVVDPRWLIKALALVIGIAAILSYLSLCLLIYQGSWQFLLHPAVATTTVTDLPHQDIRFDAAATGKPRLDGWWIAADVPTTKTILFLHDGSGSLPSNSQILGLLHAAGANIFAIDYRGFGQSDGPHPTELRMNEDSAAALDYLVNTRHIPASQIIPYGAGLGTVMAVNLTATHPELPAVILDNPDSQAFTRAVTGRKASFLPMRLLMQEHFDIATPITTLKTPKLLLANNPESSDPHRIATNQMLFHSAPDPKITVTFNNNVPTESDHAFTESVTRFLDEYVR